MKSSPFRAALASIVMLGLPAAATDDPPVVIPRDQVMQHVEQQQERLKFMEQIIREQDAQLERSKKVIDSLRNKTNCV